MDITVTYRDARDKSYSDTFDFDFDVTEKLKINRQNESAYPGKIETPAQIVYNVTGNVQVGNSAQTSTQTDIKDNVIQRSTLGAGIPMEKKDCPRCHQPIHGNEKFCSECGQNLRE